MYALDYHDYVEFQCIMTNVRLTKISKSRFHLPKHEQDRIMQILRESIKTTRSPTPLGQVDNYQDDHIKGTKSPNPRVNKTPIAGVAAAPLQPTTPTGESSIPETNAS